jgi:hypothetical protein
VEIRHKDLDIVKDNPFFNCKLGRENNAFVLTQIVESYADGFVLALNNKWGAGKTTFVKMWQQHLINKGFRTMYFNAWENDFEMEPLVAMLGELKKLIGKADNTSFKSLLEKGATISKRVLPSVAKTLSKRYLGEDFADIISNSAEAATDIFEDEVNEYINKKDNLLAFKKELENYVEENNNGNPIVFIIDELDRCRPDYAVEVLEKVKHFFNVPGIIFILSIDKEQLSYAIQGYYGSDKIDTDEYLRRFIDIEYQLPDADAKTYAKYLFDYYSFGDYFNKRVSGGDDEEGFRILSENICNVFHYTPRQQDKLFSFTRIVLRSIHSNTKTSSPDLILLLIHLKLFNTNLYEQIKDKKITTQQLVDEFESLFLSSKHENINQIIHIEALLVFFYHKYLNEDTRIYGQDISLSEKEEQSENLKFILTSETSKMPNVTYDLEKHIAYIEKVQHEYYTHSFSFFLNKVELLDNLRTN